MLSNSITSTRWDPPLFTVTQGGFSHNDQGNNFWIIVLQIWRVSCFQVTDSKLWQTYAIVKSSRWFNGSEPHTQSPGAAVRGIVRERLEADLCRGKVLVLEAGVLGAGSGPAPSRCAVFRESSDPPWFWIIGHGATCPGDHPALFQL